MKIWLRTLTCVLGLVALAPLAGATSIQLLPAASVVGVGDSFAIEIAISGLGPQGSPPSVGAFEVAVGFDPSQLGFEGASFGSLLGDPSNPAETIIDVNATAGLSDVAEVSLLSPPALDALQPDGFVLATLTFQSLALGTSSLDLSKVVVSDGFGQRLAIASLSGAEVNAVPEPAGFLSLATALLILRKRLVALA